MLKVENIIPYHYGESLSLTWYHALNLAMSIKSSTFVRGLQRKELSFDQGKRLFEGSIGTRCFGETKSKSHERAYAQRRQYHTIMEPLTDRVNI